MALRMKDGGWRIRDLAPANFACFALKREGRGRLLGLLTGWLLSALLMPSVAFPQQAPEPERVVVTVSAEARPMATVAASVTVIEEDEVRKSGAETVVDLLQTVPGLHVARTGGRGGFTTVTMRGAEASFVLVMLDGVPLNDITNQQGGAYDFSTLTLDQIARIEIVRGPLSSRFGSEAAGGVIHLISKRGEGSLDVELDGTVGNFGTQRASVSAGGAAGAIDYSLGASYLDIDEQTELDTLLSRTLSGNVGGTFGAANSWRLAARRSSSARTGFPENSGGPLFALLKEAKRTDSIESTVSAHFEREESERWFYGADVDFLSRSDDLFTPAILDQLPPSQGSQPSVKGGSEFDRVRAGVSTRLLLGDQWSMSSMLRFREERGRSNLVLADFIPSRFQLDRTTAAAAGEAHYASPRGSLTLGVRVDKSEGFDSEVSPRIGGTWSLRPGLRVKASLGEGFKLPSFFALAEPNVGNPDLLPERSRGFDTGLEFSGPGWSGSLTYFHNRFENLVDFSPEQFRLVNRDEVVGQGMEVEARAEWNESFQWRGHIRYLNLENRNSTEPLRDRPRWRGGLGLTWQPGRDWYLQWDTLWVGPRFDFQIPLPSRNVVDGYNTSTLVARYEWSPSLEFYARADNALDQDYQEFLGFPNPGLYFRAGVRYRFSQ